MTQLARRRIVLAVAAATVAGTAATLALAAVADAWLRDGTAVLVALAAVFVVQPLYVIARRATPKARP